MRRLLQWLHLWIGLSAGLLFAVLGLTGTLLAYQPEILLATQPALAVPADAPRDDARVLAQLAASGEATGADLPRDALPVWQAFAKEGRRLYLHPTDGRLLLERSSANDWMLWLRELHTHLLAGKTGEDVLGVFGIAILVLLVTGVWLWWPRSGALVESLRWHARPPLRRWFSWHRSTGALAVPLVLLLALTGVAMVYDGAARASLRFAFGDGPETKPPQPIAPDPARTIDWNAVLDAARRALPEAQLKRVSFPRKDNAVVSIRAKMPAEWHPVGRSTVWIDPYDATVLRVLDATRQETGMRANYAIYPLHMGGVGGEVYRTAVAVAGLAPTFLLATGFLFWRRRKRKAVSESDKTA
jgi:uncharacterized iron-regulated membrane protein